MADSKLKEKPRSKRVLVLFTGGTIGMVKNEDGVLDIPTDRHHFREILKTFPSLFDQKYSNEHSLSEDLLPLPECSGGDRIIYKLVSCHQLKDSSNISFEDWRDFSTFIEMNYRDFDGFVILHGTDTMTYTASVLSFMLENLAKPVVITGAQVPISQPGSDGIHNFLGAVYIAGHYPIAEVTLFFSYKLFRGNRSVKMSCEDFDAFDSPNYPLLIQMPGNSGDWYSALKKHAPQIINRPTQRSSAFRVNKNLCQDIGVLKLFPAITAAALKAFLSPTMKGVVLETFGSGNCPSDKEDLLAEIKKACQKGLIIVSCTQCLHGNAEVGYEAGLVLRDAGVVAGRDMTTEATFAKLSYVLNLNLSTIEKKNKIALNLNGELTEDESV